MSDIQKTAVETTMDKPIMLPPEGSTFADKTDMMSGDWLFNFIWWQVSLIFFVLIIVLMVWFAMKYRRRTPDQQALSQKEHSTALELGWTVPPLIIVFFIFIPQFFVSAQFSTTVCNHFHMAFKSIMMS